MAGSPAPGNRPGAAARTGPLRGLRVLDLGVVVVGAETSRLFADMGADVVKIESRRYPDGGRQTVGMTPAWAFGNRSRRSLGIDLRSPAGRELFLQLAARADAVFSNFKPGTMQRLGLDDAALRAANPDIVVVESSALGAWGPSSKNMGYGPLVRAVTGLSSVWRYPGEAAGFCDNITVYPDHTSARIGAVTALALLLQRRAGGHGGHAAIAQAEVILGQLAPYYLRDSLEPGSFRARGNTSESDAPAGVFPCAGDDEWCAVEVRGDDDWRRLCHAIGQPELARDPSLGSAAQRLANRDRLEHLLAQWLATRSPQAAAQTLQGHGVPAGMMLRPMELLDDPQLRARSFFRMLHQPETGDLPTEAGPALFGRIDPPVPRRAPRFGEHTREVVREWLGLDPATIEDLVKNGTLEE